MTTLSLITGRTAIFHPVSTVAITEVEPDSLTQIRASDEAVSLPQEAFALCGSDVAQRLNKLAGRSSIQLTSSSLVTNFRRLTSQIQKAECLSSGVKINSESDISDYQNARKKSLHAVSGTLASLSSAINKNSFQSDCSFSRVSGQCEGLANAIISVSVSADDSNISYSDFWAQIADDLGSINTDYVQFYADLMEKYTAVYQAWTNVQNAESNCVREGSDGNHINFGDSGLETAYAEFEKVISQAESSLSVPNWSSMSTEQRSEMKSTLAPAFKVDDNGLITIDTSAYDSVRNGHVPSGDITVSEYNAWLTSFNSVGSTLQSNMQSFAQRYSQANTTFDNLNKVLSSAITSLSDSLKGFLQF